MARRRQLDAEFVRRLLPIGMAVRGAINRAPRPQVSWIRQREVNGLVKPALLTTGSFTYTSDQRFGAAFRSPLMQQHQPADNSLSSTASDWILQIKYVQLRDAGVYECQVSTEPRITMEFHLKVVGTQGSRAMARIDFACWAPPKVARLSQTNVRSTDTRRNFKLNGRRLCDAHS